MALESFLIDEFTLIVGSMLVKLGIAMAAAMPMMATAVNSSISVKPLFFLV